MNKVVYVTEWEQLRDLWKFFLQGLEVLNSPKGGNAHVDENRFFKTLLRVALGDLSEGAVLVLTTEEDKPLAYTVLLNNTAWFAEKSALCFAVYSNNRCPTAVKQLDKEVARWCRKFMYLKLTAASRRITGGAVRLFEKKWGFRRECLVFSRNV